MFQCAISLFSCCCAMCMSDVSVSREGSRLTHVPLVTPGELTDTNSLAFFRVMFSFCLSLVIWSPNLLRNKYRNEIT